MRRWKCIVSYDGSLFSGFQIQPKKRTVQGEIEHILRRMHGKDIRITASGRTDAGVHAIGQVFHFDSYLDLSGNDWKRALNAQLPEDILIIHVEAVSDQFHARFDVKEKEYHYFVLNTREPDVFKRNYAYHFPHKLEWESIDKACSLLEGTHDFTAFSSAKATVKGSKVRTMYRVSYMRNGNEVEFIFRGSGFLYNMVRILVGVLLDVGQGNIQPEDILYLFEQKDRRLVGKTMPPQGLYLWEVGYDDL